MGLLCKKQLQFFKLSDIILSYLAALCNRSVFETRRQFPMKEIANFHCMDHIIHWDIMKVAMTPLNLDEQENQVLNHQAFQMLYICKGKRLQWLQCESYLDQYNLKIIYATLVQSFT